MSLVLFALLWFHLLLLLCFFFNLTIADKNSDFNISGHSLFLCIVGCSLPLYKSFSMYIHSSLKNFLFLYYQRPVFGFYEPVDEHVIYLLSPLIIFMYICNTHSFYLCSFVVVPFYFSLSTIFPNSFVHSFLFPVVFLSFFFVPSSSCLEFLLSSILFFLCFVFLGWSWFSILLSFFLCVSLPVLTIVSTSLRSNQSEVRRIAIWVLNWSALVSDVSLS